METIRISMHDFDDRPGERVRFAQRVAAALQRHGVPGPMPYDRQRFALTLPGGPLRLGNIYLECGMTPPEAHEQMIEAFAAGMAELVGSAVPASLADARPQLRVDVRAMAEIEREQRSGRQTVWTPIAEGLARCLVLDTPRAKRFLTRQEVAGWSAEPEALLELGEQNLLRHSEPGLQRTPQGFWVSTWRDDYDAARMTLPGLLHEATGIGGELVVMLLSPVSLLVAPAAEPRALAAMAQFAYTLLEVPRFRSAKAYVERQGQWQLFLPPADHPAAGPLQGLSVHTDLVWHDLRND